MRNRLAFYGLTALALALVDLGVKEWLPESGLRHERSSAWVVLSAALLVGCVAVAALSSRRIAATAAALTAGGVAGNLASVGRDGAVPNPLLVGGSNGIGFNLADVFVVVGLALLVVALLSASVRHRDRLLPPRRWEQRLVEWLRR